MSTHSPQQGSQNPAPQQQQQQGGGPQKPQQQGGATTRFSDWASI